MDIKEMLQDIFEEDDGRIHGMLEALNRAKVFKEEDLKYLDEDSLKKDSLDEDSLKEENFFTTIEIKKLIDYIRRNKSLKPALKDIFGNVNASKFSKIEQYFEENEVYTAEDLTLFDLDKITRKSDIFSDLDVQKIRNYIKKHNVDKFEEIKSNETSKRKMKEDNHKTIVQKREIDLANKSKHFESLLKTKEILLNQEFDLQNKTADLAIAYMKHGTSHKQNWGLQALPSTISCANPNLATGLAIGLEALNTVTDAYMFHSKTATYRDDKNTLEKRVEAVQRDSKTVDNKIHNELEMGHEELSLDSGFKFPITDVSDDFNN